ncbi:hypothetical protein L917_11082, partial [Phytophthora nicotianae]
MWPITEVNGFRASVFLVASATGHKLPPFVVFSGVPDARVAAEVWKFSITGCRLLVLDSLKTHKMAS